MIKKFNNLMDPLAPIFTLALCAYSGWIGNWLAWWGFLCATCYSAAMNGYKDKANGSPDKARE